MCFFKQVIKVNKYLPNHLVIFHRNNNNNSQIDQPALVLNCTILLNGTFHCCTNKTLTQTRETHRRPAYWLLVSTATGRRLTRGCNNRGGRLDGCTGTTRLVFLICESGHCRWPPRLPPRSYRNHQPWSARTLVNPIPHRMLDGGGRGSKELFTSRRRLSSVRLEF